MQVKRHGRLALFGMLALALSVMVGLVGSADAAKKKKKKGANGVVVQKLNVPIADRAVGAPQAAVTPIDFAVPNSFGKKIVANTTITIQITGSGPDYLDDLEARLVAPNGRRVGVNLPNSGIAPNQSFGPTTFTANTQNDYCFDPTPPCDDPDDVIGPPSYAGNVRELGMTDFDGVKMKGKWTLKILDFSNTLAGTVNLAKLQVKAAKPPEV
jgi:subtilisin-like proprotein convertase family protein